MPCDLSLLVSKVKNGTVETQSLSLNLSVEENESVTLADAVKAILQMSEDQRQQLVHDIRSGTTQNITSSMLQGVFKTGPLATEDQDGNKPIVRIVGNTTIKDLQGLYPTLKDKYSLDEKSLGEYDSYTIITGNRVKITGVNINGRVNIKGQNVFVLTDYASVQKFFSYLHAREAVRNVFGAETVPEEFQKYMPVLEIIAKEEGYPSAVDTILAYLDNAKKFQPFKHNTTAGPRIITSQKILGEIVAKVTNSYDADMKYTDMESAIKSASTDKAGKFTWTLEKEELYNILKLYIPNLEQQIPLSEFRAMDKAQLDRLFTGPNGIFYGHPTLFLSRVSKETKTQSITEETVSREKTITADQMGRIWPKLAEVMEQMITQAKASNDPNLAWLGEYTIPKNTKTGYKAYFPTTSRESSYINALKKMLTIPEIKAVFKEVLGTDVLGVTEVDSGDGKKKLQYTYTKLSTKEKSSGTKDVITLNFPYMTLDEAYGVAYDTESLFTPTTDQRMGVIGGEYNGMYIYEATLSTKEGPRKVYQISRSIMSPKIHAKGFATLESAMKAIDDKNNFDVIYQSGLISIKQVSGMPRYVKLEMQNVVENQIISVLDMALPVSSNKRTPKSQTELLNMTMSQFKNVFGAVEGIEKINTPEKAAAFIYKIYSTISAADMSQAVNSLSFRDSLVTLLTSNTYGQAVQDIIEEIDSTRKIHYYVESISSRSKMATVRPLRDGVNDVDLTGTRIGETSVKNFVGQTLEKALDHLSNKYGIQAEMMSIEELQQLDEQEHLGISDRIKSIRAFVHKGKIYINRARAHNSDLYHEVSHLFLGVLRAQSPEAYLKVLEFYEKNHPVKFKKTMERVKGLYKGKDFGRAYQDLMEETVAHIMGDLLDHSESLNYSGDGFNAAEFDEVFNTITREIRAFVDAGPNPTNDFDTYLRSLLAQGEQDELDEQGNVVKNGVLVRQRKLAALVGQYLDSKNGTRITEDCK